MQSISVNQIGQSVYTLDKTTFKVKTFKVATITDVYDKNGKKTYLGEGSPTWESHPLEQCFSSMDELAVYIGFDVEYKDND